MSFSTTQLVGFGARRRSSVITGSYASLFTQSGTNTTSPSFSVDIGTAATGRFVILAVSYYSLSNGSMSSPTIDGGAATIIVQGVATAGQAGLAIIGRQMDTGGSVTFAATMSASAQLYDVAVFDMLNVGAIAGHATATDLVPSSSVVDCTINIPAGGALIAAISGVDATSATWTGPTERYDRDYSTIVRSGTFDTFASAQTGYSVSANGSGLAARGVLCAVSFAAA